MVSEVLKQIQFIESKPQQKNRPPNHGNQIAERLSVNKQTSISDTIRVRYAHLKSDFYHTLLVDQSNQVTVTTWPSQRQHLKVEVIQDTLHINYRPPENVVSPSSVHQDFEFIVTVGVHTLESITANRRGNITNYNRHKDRTTPPSFAWHQDHLDINLHGGKVELFVDINHLQVLNFEDRSALYLAGNTQQLSVQSPKDLHLVASMLKADSVFIDWSDRRMDDHSPVLVFAKDHLNVNLHSYKDIVYFGHPTIDKQERSMGRLIDGNAASKIQ